VVGDVNGDGLDDIVAGGFGNGNVYGTRVFLARGSGFFGAADFYPYLPSGERKLADVDNDGDRDLVVVAGTYLYVVKNLGNGTFTSKTSIPLSGTSSDVDTADFNGDGLIDIATGGNPITVHLNQGGGTYAPGVTYGGFDGPHIEAADMDGDGDPDLVLMNGHSFRILMNQGNGTFVVGSTTTTDMYGNYFDLATGDDDGDGDIDVLMTDIEYCGVRVKKNPGNGVFPSVMGDLRLCTTFQYNHDLLVADFNGDNIADYLSPLGDKTHVYLMPSGGGTQSYWFGESPGTVLAGDFDGDGDQDAAVAGGGGTKIMINDGAGVFATNDVSTILDLGFSAVFTATDVNSDGLTDIVNTTSIGIGVRTGLGNGTFNASVDYPTASNPSNVVAGDVNGDGKPDLAVAHGQGSTVSVLMNQGNGTYAPKVDYPTASKPYGLALEDINGDNKRDLIVGGLNAVTVRLNQGTGTFSLPNNYTIGSSGVLSVLDLNSDGRLDIVAPSAAGSMALGMLINQGNGTFVRGADVAIGDIPSGFAQADFDGDGRVDLVVAHGNNHRLEVLHNNGNGTLTTQYLSSWYWSTDVVTGDMNRDGIPDIIADFFSAGGYAQIGVLTNAGNGTSFATAGYSLAGWAGSVSRIVPADFNGDGNPDLAYSWGSKIYIRFNTCWQ